MVLAAVLIGLALGRQEPPSSGASGDPLAAFQEKLRKAKSVEFDEICYAGSTEMDLTYREKERRFPGGSFKVHVKLAKPNKVDIVMQHETIVADGQSVRYFDPVQRVWAQAKQESNTLRELFEEPDLQIWASFFDLPSYQATQIKPLGSTVLRGQKVNRFSFGSGGTNSIGAFESNGMLTDLRMIAEPFTASEEAEFAIQKVVLDQGVSDADFVKRAPASFERVSMNRYCFTFGVLTNIEFHIAKVTHRLVVIHFERLGHRGRGWDFDRPELPGEHPGFYVAEEEALVRMANSFVYTEAVDPEGDYRYPVGARTLSDFYLAYGLSIDPHATEPALVVVEPSGRMVAKIEGYVGNREAAAFLQKFAKGPGVTPVGD